jgi:SAM-dependent methyltransferase
MAGRTDLDAKRALSFGRFADEYERTRPGYPPEAAEWMAPGEPELVVELGAGTGKLTRAVARHGRRVVAVEPDDRMRAVLASLALPGVEAIAGSAEALPVGDHVADAVVSGSAFHWFDLDRTLSEAARVLVPGGTLAFAWNHRDDRIDWVRRMSEAIRQGDQWAGNRPWRELVEASGLFGPVERAEFTHVVAIPRGALGDHLRSYSLIGSLPPNEQEVVVARVDAVLAAEPTLDGSATLAMPFVIEGYRTSVRPLSG